MQLSPEAYALAAGFLDQRARPLEAALFGHSFGGAPATAAVSELEKFANPDSGFGHGLEPDLCVPDSSGLATSHGLTILRELGQPADHPLVAGALAWLVENFDSDVSAWRAVPPNVDEHPRAPHWNAALHAPGGGWPVAVIPSAEVLSHFLHYGAGRDEQISAATTALLDALPETSLGPDSVLYLDRLARTEGIPGALEDALAEHLPRLALDMVERDPDQWDGYVANPLKLAPTPSCRVASVLSEWVDTNLDWALERQRPDGSWAPNWTWQGNHPEAWEIAHVEWQGILTLERLESFRAYGRIAS